MEETAVFEPEDFFPEYQSEKERKELPYLEIIPELLNFCAHRYACRRALIEGNRVILFSDLPGETDARRRILEKRKLSLHSHIGILCSKRAETGLWFLAVTCSGRVAVMLPPEKDPEKLRALASKFDMAAMIADKVYEEAARSAVQTVIAASEKTEDETRTSGQAGKFLLSDPPQKDTPAAIFFTGGSTGTPKGALLTHGALTRGALCGTTFREGFVFGNVTIAMLPMHHIFGAVAGFLSCFYSGTEMYLFSDLPTAIGKIPMVRPTMLVLVPGLAELILGLAKRKGKAFLGDLKSIICGGAAVNPGLIRGMYEYGVRIYPGYGLTEAANFTAANLNAVEKPDSVGHLYPHQKMKIVDGELWLKGDNLMLGYFGDEAETAAVFSDGWLKTGDLVSADSDGYLYVIGRKKNMIVLAGGENIYPEVLEEKVKASGPVRDCLIREKETGGRRVLAVEIFPEISAFPGKTFSEIETAMRIMISKLNAALPGYEQIIDITVRQEDFPRMPSMKIDRKAFS